MNRSRPVPQSRHRSWPWLLAVTVILTAALAVLAGQWRQQAAQGDPPLAGAAIGGPFKLVDQDGRPFTDARLKGRYALVYFGYSFCPDACPTDLAMLAQGLRRFEQQDPARAAKVLPVFITVDPERDTPAQVKSFVAAFHPRMIGLTGSRPAIDQALKAYRVFSQRQGPAGAKDYLMDHSRAAYLFGPDGKPMLLFAATDTPDSVARDLDRWVE
jgi:protein SCO1